MMIFVTRLLFSELLLLMLAGVAVAGEDVTTRALQLYEKHRYEDAARLLRPALATMDGNQQAGASLALGMNYLGSAMLYRDLHKTALVIELDYLAQLKKQKTKTPSRYVYLYLGQVLLEAGKPAEAANYLRMFSRQKGVAAAVRPYADIELGIAYTLQKQAEKATYEWSRVDIAKPEIKAALAGVYAMAGVNEKQPEHLADAVMKDAKSQHSIVSARMVRNILRAYSYSGATEKALDLISSTDLGDASLVENLGASKSISFYDSSVLADLARVHLQAAVLYLERAKKDVNLSNTAEYYLATAYLQLGNAELSLRSSASFLSQAKLPQQYKNITLVNQASAHSMSGRHADAGAAWMSIVDKSAEDPLLLAAVMMACTQFGEDCSKLEKRSLSAVEKGEGRKFSPLNVALGKYYLARKKYPDAMLYLEAGRDKANKNNIEVNDPQMLIGLAEANYRNKKFSENLEIYFEIGKQFPAVRQIQDSMQGIYAMEQQSAGDVKIF